MMRQVSSPVRRGAGRKGQKWTSLAAYPASKFHEYFCWGNFPQLFCLSRRHVGYVNFGTFEFANSIRPFVRQAGDPCPRTSLGVEQPVPRIFVRLAPLLHVFRHSARSWPSQGDTIRLIRSSTCCSRKHDRPQYQFPEHNNVGQGCANHFSLAL